MESLCLSKVGELLVSDDEVEVEGKRGDYSRFWALFSWQER